MLHDFVLVATAEHSPADYLQLLHHPNAIHVHDDVLHYIGDSLTWIPSLNPATGKHGHGLNFYGPTAVLVDGAAVAARVFKAWAGVFKLGPSDLVLTGSWTMVEGDPSAGAYERFRSSRDDLVTAFENIAVWCDLVEGSAGARFLMHLGI